MIIIPIGSCSMAAKRKKKVERPVFDSIRKPLAPPSQKMGEEKPESKVHPAGRGVKHKKRIEIEE